MVVDFFHQTFDGRDNFLGSASVNPYLRVEYTTLIVQSFVLSVAEIKNKKPLEIVSEAQDHFKGFIYAKHRDYVPD